MTFQMPNKFKYTFSLNIINMNDIKRVDEYKMLE